MDDLVDVAIARLKTTNVAKSGDAIVVMAGSNDSGAAATDTVRMVIIP
jgi:lysophospholipase L1-like esterase